MEIHFLAVAGDVIAIEVQIRGIKYRGVVPRADFPHLENDAILRPIAIVSGPENTETTTISVPDALANYHEVRVYRAHGDPTIEVRLQALEEKFRNNSRSATFLRGIKSMFAQYSPEDIALSVAAIASIVWMLWPSKPTFSAN